MRYEFKTKEVTKIIECHKRFIPSLTSKFGKHKEPIFEPQKKGSVGEYSFYSYKEVIVLGLLHECRSFGLSRNWAVIFDKALGLINLGNDEVQKLKIIIEQSEIEALNQALRTKHSLEKSQFDNLDLTKINKTISSLNSKLIADEFNPTGICFIDNKRYKLIVKQVYLNIYKYSKDSFFLEYIYTINSNQFIKRYFSIENKNCFSSKENLEKFEKVKSLSSIKIEINLTKIIEQIYKNIKKLI